MWIKGQRLHMLAARLLAMLRHRFIGGLHGYELPVHSHVILTTVLEQRNYDLQGRNRRHREAE